MKLKTVSQLGTGLGNIGFKVALDLNNPNRDVIGERKPIKVPLVPVIHIWKNSSTTGAHFHERSIRVLIYFDEIEYSTQCLCNEAKFPGEHPVARTSDCSSDI